MSNNIIFRGQKISLNDIDHKDLVKLKNDVIDHKYSYEKEIRNARDKAYGLHIDTAHFSKLLGGLATAKKQMRKIDMAFTDRRDKNKRTFERAFIDCADEILDRETFFAIVEMAKNIINGDEI